MSGDNKYEDERFVRFVGDPTGFRVRRADLRHKPDADGTCWVSARIGYTDKQVRIDVKKAYLIEEIEHWPFVRPDI